MYARLQAVISTCRKQGRNVFATLRDTSSPASQSPYLQAARQLPAVKERLAQVGGVFVPSIAVGVLSHFALRKPSAVAALARDVY